MSNDTTPHTPSPWPRHDAGGTLPGVYWKRDRFRYGPQTTNWIWGSRSPGYGVVADCSPHCPDTEETADSPEGLGKLASELRVEILDFSGLNQTEGERQ